MKKSVILGLCFCLSWSLWAGHILGGTLNYKLSAQSGNLYKYDLALEIYKDCTAGSANFDFEIVVGCFRNDTLISTQGCDFTSSQQIFSSPSGLCVVVGNYTGVIILPLNNTGYTLAFQRCCRDNATKNLIDGNNHGMTITATIPSVVNNTPNFTNYFPVYAVVGQPFSQSYAATDVDGDLLVYQFDELLNGGAPNNPFPNPPSAPPYEITGYFAPYLVNNLLNGNPPFVYNSTTGLMTCTPTAIGRFSIGLKIQEIRNGTLIATHHQEMTLFVLNAYPVGISPENKSEIAIYPNPIQDELVVNSSLPPTRLALYNSQNQLLLTEEKGNRISTSSLPEGMYWLQIWIDGQVYWQKVIK